MFLRPMIPTIGSEPRQTLALLKRLAPANVRRPEMQPVLHFEPSELSTQMDRPQRLRPNAR
jgi:hypothetical protein